MNIKGLIGNYLAEVLNGKTNQYKSRSVSEGFLKDLWTQGVLTCWVLCM